MSRSPRSILVTGANGDISDAIGRIIAERWPECALHGADASGPWPGLGLFAQMHPLPLARDAAFLPALQTLQAQHGFDLIIPVPEPELARLAEPAAQESGLPLLMNAPQTITMGCDKFATAQWLQSHDIPAPATHLLELANPQHLPLFVKPRFGYGSRDLALIETTEALLAIQQTQRVPSVAQAWIPDSDGEFTCALLKVGEHTRRITLKRWLQGGLTGRAEVVDDPAINAYLDKILAALPDRNAVNVQLRIADGQPLAFEINPRFSSTAMMRHRLGFADVAWMIDYALNQTPPPVYTPQPGARVFRLSREVTAPPLSAATTNP
ncbi:ATP-grasp domain-containing protein [Magnetofaba australis]|uniref:ATP-grasp fold PylC-type domain-containing protein n=1 Tax=Magnetofaba australis IT-1 TaxID=1434232 RepID=A0A1Y2K3T5_9PROT|nr:ATP-grasp domain-containing protein [Magnetofaba australis]OSM02296.1 hypothetical protein MAIT1_02416 [Magnetofaba australis IT-1]